MDLQRILFFFFAFASAAQGSHPGANCFNLVVPIKVQTNVVTFNVAPFANTYESKAFLVKSIARSANLAALVGNETPLKEKYDIAVSYCEPLHYGTKPKTLQILSHGFGFDKSYVSSSTNTLDLPLNILNCSLKGTGASAMLPTTMSWRQGLPAMQHLLMID